VTLGRPARRPPVSLLTRWRSARVAEAAPLDAAHLPAGTLLGGACIDAPLAAGTEGVVYAARNAGLDGAPDALVVKAQAAHGFDAAARTRFLADGERASRLDHPGIVRVVGGGISRGVAFLVMERAAGVALTHYAERARLLPEPLVLEIAAQTAEALAHAHRLGLAHRDVKPANLVFDAATRQVKLLDFGLARSAEHDATRSGQLLGSPQYMAPELLAGAPPDAASDLYALGATAFELLAGEPLFAAPTMGELLRAVAAGVARPLGALRPDLPPAHADALDALLSHLLAADPAQRQRDGDAWAAGARAMAARWA
jgi:eukaryotic-like serine/threonine-protein kinase